MELSQVLQALRNADAAGDVEAARRLAQIADKLMRAGPAPAAAPEAKPAEGFFAAIGKGAESALSAARAGVKGIYAPEEAAREAKARGEDIGKRYADQVSLEKVKEAYEKRGLLPAAGEAISQIPYAIAEQGANIGATLAGARLGATAGAPFGAPGVIVGGLAGAALPSLFQQAGGNIQRQAETGQPIDRAAAYGAAVPQAALDVAGTIIPLGRTVAGKVFGPTVAKLLERGAEESAERLAKESLTKVLAKGTGIGALAEVPTEVVQQMLERAQAGLALTSTDAIKEYGETAYQTALLAPIGAAGRVAERGQAREIVEERQQKTLAEQAKEKRNAQLAAEEAEEARKQSPDYAQTFATQHEALQQEYNDLTATLKQKLPKGASFADKQANKDLLDRRKELAEQLKEQAPEYNRVMGILKPIRDQEAAAAQQAEAQRAQAEAQRLQATELAAQREVPQEAQTQPYFQEPQGTLPGMEAVPTATPMPEAEAPVDYVSQANNLRNYLDEIRTRAQGTTDLDAKLQLGEEYARVQVALKEAETLSKTAGKSADKQVDLLRKKMAVAEEEGDIDAQVKIAKQLKELGLTDLAQATTQADLGLGKPQELSKLKVPTDIADIQRAEAEKAAAQATQQAQAEEQRTQEAEQFRQASQLEMFAPAREQVTRTVQAPRMSAQAQKLQTQIDALEVRRAEAADRPERAVAIDKQIGTLQAQLDALAPEVTETRRVGIPPQEATPVTQPAPALTKQITTLTERVLASPQVDEETKAVVQQIQTDVPAFIRTATARAAEGATEMRQRAATAKTQGAQDVYLGGPSAEVFTPEQTAAWLYRTLNTGRADPADTARVRGVLQSMEGRVGTLTREPTEAVRRATQPELPGVEPKPAPAPAPAEPISTLATREAADATKRREEQARLERAEAGPRTLVQFEQQTGETLADEQYTKLVEAAYNPRLGADERLQASEQADAYLQQKLAKLEAAEASRPALIQKKQADLAAAEQRLAKLNEQLQGVKLTTREKAKTKGDTAAQEQILEGKRTKLQAAIKTEEAKRDKHQRLLSTAQGYPKVTRVDPADIRAYREELNAEILRTRTPGERLGVTEGTQKRALGPVTRAEVIPPKVLRTESPESRAGLTATDTRQKLTEARGEKQRDIPMTWAEQAAAELAAAPIRAERKARAEAAAKAAAEKAAEQKKLDDEAKARLRAAQSNAPKAKRRAKAVAEIEELESWELDDVPTLQARGVEVESPDLAADQVKALEDNDVAQALALLSTDKTADPVHRAVAQRLAQLLDATDVEVRDTLTDSEGNPVLGQALASGKKIRLSRAGGLTQEVLLHEGTHAAAERILEAPESSLTPLQLAAKRELQALHAAIKRDPSITSTDAKASLSEFVAEVMSNRNLQQQLAKKPWRLSDALKAFKSVILRLLGVKETQSMLGAAMKSVDAIFQPTSVQTFKAEGVRTQYSQKDIAALHDGSNSMRQFAENFPQYIKQKDRTPEDVDRIGGEYLLDMRYHPKDYVALAEPERLYYKADTIMSDGTVFDPENPLHLVEATPTTFVALEAQKDESLRKSEAKEINKKRLNDLMDLLEDVFGVEPGVSAKYVKTTSYTLPEKALVAKAASKYGVQSTPAGRLKLVTIDANNRHPVAVVSKEAVDAIIEGLRAGKNLKTAFLDGMQRVADDNAKKNSAKNGWQKFDQSDTETAAIALNAGAAGTSWCTGGSVSTARSQIKDGDFYIYYKDGKPEVAVRMNGANKIGEIRGNTPNQWLTPEQQKIAEAFLRTKTFDGSERFIEETERKAQLARVLTDKAEPGDSFIFVDALNSDQTAFKDYKLDDLFEFRMLDGYARSMRPKPSDAIAKTLYTKAIDVLVQDMGKGYIPFDIRMEADGTGFMTFGGQKIDNIKAAEIVHAKTIMTPYTSTYKNEKELKTPFVFSSLKSVGGFYLGGGRPVEMPALQHARRIVIVTSDVDLNIKLSDKAIVDHVSTTTEDTSINIKGGYYVNVYPVKHYGTKFVVMNATVEAPYVSVTPYTPDFSSAPKAEDAPPLPVINTPNKIGDAPPVKTAGPEAEERLLFARVSTAPRGLNPALADAEAVARRVVAGNRSWWQSVKANTTGLGFETQAIDRFAGFERLSKYLPKLQGTQMMYYLRMYDQRMNFVSQSAVNGALDLREVQRKDGEREFIIESQDGTSLRSVVTTLKRATPMVGNADATSRLFTLYVAANRAKRVGYDKLDLSGQVTEQELKDTLRQVDSVPGLKDVFETARDQYNEYNEGLVRFAQKTGVFSKEYADKLLSAKDYIPWYRSRNGVVELVIGGEVPFKVGNVKDMPHLAELVGGDKPILDFTISSVQNTNMLVDMSLRNLATKNAVMELVDLGAAKVTNKPISGTDVVKFRVKGEDRYAILDTETIKINGKDVNTGIPADIVVKGMEGIPVQLTGVMRAMALPTNVLRKAITLMPPYMLRQIVRDSTQAFIASGADATPVLGALREIGSAAGKKLEKRGIVGGQMFTGTTEDISLIMREIVSGGNLFNSSVGKLEALGMEADALTRRAQYNSYIKQGLSEMEATLLALESMNFNKRGASPSIHFANSMIPFFNAQVQGLNVLYRAMFGQITAGEKARIKQKLITRGAMMFAVSLAYTHAMQDDEAYKNALPEDKYGNWFVRIPGIAEPLRVPIPFELGYIFKALPEALYNTIVNKHGKDEAAQAFKAILRNTIPGGSSYFIPQVFKPGIEVASNFSFFTGRDIVSTKEQLLLPEQQYRDNTTELAKLFGGAGISPIKFEALIRGYLGGAGMAVLGALSLPMVREGPEKATKRMSDMPVVGTMFQPNDARWIINNAFDQLREAQQVQASFKDLVNKGERAEAKQLLETRATDYARAELGGYLRQQMGELTQLETAIKASNKSPEEKRKLLDKVQQTRIKLASMVRDASDATKLQAQAT